MDRIFPLVSRLREYDRSAFSSDGVAGLTVGVMLIPQGMAYAMIAGLPPIYGLYASLLPLIVYGLLGTSRQLAVGPVAMVSLLVAAGVAPIAGGDTELFITLAIVLSLMVGLIQFVLGVARFGFLTNFLSHPVLSGFTSAAALIIGLNQVKHVLGIQLPRTNYVHEILMGVGSSLGQIHPATLIIGLGSIAALILLKRWRKAFPGALAVVVIGTLAVWIGGLDQGGVRIVGEVPSGLPTFLLPDISWTYVRDLMPTALAIALVGFMESIAVAKSFAAKHRYEVDSNQELIALGLANVAGGLFQAYPTTGGFSRTAVNDQAGARSTVATLISAAVIGVTLLFLTPLFRLLPNAVLGAVIIVAVAGLFDWKEMRFLWRVRRTDFAMLAVTFFATLLLGIEEGILVGVIASLVLVIHQTSRPYTAFLGRIPGTETYRNLARNPEAIPIDGVGILRVDAALYFANVSHVREQLGRLEASTPDMHTLIYDAYPMNRIDSSAVHAIQEMARVLSERGVRVLFAGVKGPVMDVFRRGGLVSAIGEAQFFPDVHAAVVAASGPVSETASATDGPLVYS